MIVFMSLAASGWLAVTTCVMAMCRAAAAGDLALARA